MSDYTKSTNFTAKDSTNDTILGSEHDAEYDAIATASATKANKVAGATLDNIATTDATGDTKDSGVGIAALNTLITDAASLVGTPVLDNLLSMDASGDLKDSGIAVGDVVTPSSTDTLTNKTHTSPVLNTGVSGSAVDTDAALAADSDTLLPSQKAVKAYADALVTDSGSASNGSITVGSIIFKWGYVDDASGGDTDVTFATAFPTACFMAQGTDFDSGNTGGTGSATLLNAAPTTTGLSFSTSNGHSRLYWFAIGN